jgi:Ca2+-binding EF-hand superfamily protein
LVLSQAEIEALESLASNSAMQAERSLLEKLKMLKYEAEIADVLDADCSSQQMQVMGSRDELDFNIELDDSHASMSGGSSTQVGTAVATGGGGRVESVAAHDSQAQNREDDGVEGAEEGEKKPSFIEAVIKAGDAVKSKVGNKKPTSDEPDEDSDEEYSSDDEEEERVLLGSEVEKDVELVQRGKDRLDEMLARLEKDIEETDMEIGSSLNLLDQNHDGICTTQEIRNAFVGVLADHDHLEADALIEALDPLGRGYIQISELHDLLEGLQDDNSKKAIFEYLQQGQEDERDDD